MAKHSPITVHVFSLEPSPAEGIYLFEHSTLSYHVRHVILAAFARANFSFLH